LVSTETYYLTSSTETYQCSGPGGGVEACSDWRLKSEPFVVAAGRKKGGPAAACCNRTDQLYKIK